MPFKIFNSLFPKAKIESLHTTKNNLLILKAHNNSNIEQIAFVQSGLKHKDKVIRCRFFVVPGDDDPVLPDY